MNTGLKIKYFTVPHYNIQEEEFIPITPCWICYQYNHNVKDCPDKDNQLTLCSECSGRDHTFKTCTNKDKPKCLNCDGQHRTLAAACPIRKELIRQKRQEKKEAKQNFVKENKTYCEVTKLSQKLPQVIQQNQPQQQEKTILNLTSDISVKLMGIIIQAHLVNIARPGTFGRVVKELLVNNNLPSINMPDDSPSAEIFGAMRLSAQPRQVQQQQQQQQQVTTEEDMERMEGATAVEHTEIAESESDEEIEEGGEMERTEISPLAHTPVKKKAKLFEGGPPPPPPSPTKTGTVPKPQRQQPVLKQKQQQESQQQQDPIRRLTEKDIELKFYTIESHRLPSHLPNSQMIKAIDTNKIKFTFNGNVVAEDDVLRYIRQNKLSTKEYEIKILDVPTYKKLRTGSHTTIIAKK